MSFESRIIAFSERFLSDRTFQLIVAPAIADLQFDQDTRPLNRATNRLAVLRAVAGALRDEVTRNAGSFVVLTLMPACYYIFLLVLWVDFFSTSTIFFAVVTLVLVLSLGPVMVCFWPERHTVRPVD